MEHEISQEFDLRWNCKDALCSKCGLVVEDLRATRWVCHDIFTRVADYVFGTSATIKDWNDVMGKLARLYCLNKTEAEAGVEPNDEIVEGSTLMGYVLIKDKRGLLLIVLHDQQHKQNFIWNKEESVELHV